MKISKVNYLSQLLASQRSATESDWNDKLRSKHFTENSVLHRRWISTLWCVCDSFEAAQNCQVESIPNRPQQKRTLSLLIVEKSTFK